MGACLVSTLAGAAEVTQTGRFTIGTTATACDGDGHALATTLAALTTIATSTITTLLYKRGLRNVFLQGARPLKPGQPPRRSPCATSRCSPTSTAGLDAFLDRRDAQRLAVAQSPAGAVLAMDWRGDVTAAAAASILAIRMQVRGVAGIVADGGCATLAASPGWSDLPGARARRRRPIWFGTTRST